MDLSLQPVYPWQPFLPPAALPGSFSDLGCRQRQHFSPRLPAFLWIFPNLSPVFPLSIARHAGAQGSSYWLQYVAFIAQLRA
ncbi:hypothetical protein M569_17697 [Genlisea aurea]|uniref:Uncharacterized protein n=1 Tax=Genlisea aurea TaxID=192259 RepID=S8BR71_9LAMI|nr:hypothetical protein M569_17697 [Genlisea aurea]